MRTIHIILPKDLVKLSNFAPQRPSHLRKLSFEILVSSTVRIHAEELETGSTETRIYLWDNSIEYNRTQALGGALKNSSTLISLDLQHSSIGPEGAKALAEALKTNSTVMIHR